MFLIFSPIDIQLRIIAFAHHNLLIIGNFFLFINTTLSFIPCQEAISTVQRRFKFSSSAAFSPLLDKMTLLRYHYATELQRVIRVNNPKVSIICLLYNMKEYIAQALDGMLMQKTDFPFEIIVHDDASTDGSTAILREYVEKYPDIIVPIFQTENQYSKKVSLTKNFIFPMVRGEYVCYCEGDDYWTDPLKLQKQYDFMSTHPDYSLCAAKIRQINCSDSSIPDKLIGPFNTGEVTIEEILAQKDKQAFATCSLFIRKNVFFARPENFPGRGERVIILWLALNGRVWFINEEMGVYRRARPGSWTDRSWNRGNKTKIQTYFGYIRVYKHFNDFCNNRFDDIIQDILLRYMTLSLRAGATLKQLRDDSMKEFYDFLTPANKRRLFIYKMLLPVRKVASAVKKRIK